MSNFLFSGMGDNQSSFVTMLLIYAVIIIGFYFIFIRPQNKKKKQEEEMRNNLKIGDEITTIGGIVGKIVSIKDDTNSIVIETGIDRSKINIKKWALASRNTAGEPESK